MNKSVVKSNCHVRSAYLILVVVEVAEVIPGDNQGSGWGERCILCGHLHFKANPLENSTITCDEIVGATRANICISISPVGSNDRGADREGLGSEGTEGSG